MSKKPQTEQHEQYLKECLTIFPETISEEFVRTPADLAHWNAQFAEAQREALAARASEKQIRAQTYLEVKGAAAESGTKMTEAATDAHVETHPDVMGAVQRSIEAEGNKAKLYGIVDAVRCKREMLITLGNFMRTEMEGDMSLRKRVSEQRRLGDDS